MQEPWSQLSGSFLSSDKLGGFFITFFLYRRLIPAGGIEGDDSKGVVLECLSLTHFPYKHVCMCV